VTGRCRPAVSRTTGGKGIDHRNGHVGRRGECGGSERVPLDQRGVDLPRADYIISDPLRLGACGREGVGVRGTHRSPAVVGYLPLSNRAAIGSFGSAGALTAWPLVIGVHAASGAHPIARKVKAIQPSSFPCFPRSFICKQSCPISQHAAHTEIPPSMLDDLGPFGHTREIERPAPVPRSMADSTSVTAGRPLVMCKPLQLSGFDAQAVWLTMSTPAYPTVLNCRPCFSERAIRDRQAPKREQRPVS
jgi:hypothetical protein